MGEILLKDPLFWEKAWKKEVENSHLRRGRKTLQDTVNFWNKRADNFQKNVMGKQGDNRVNRVLDWLDRQGVELAGKDVLDIGAGPGAFSLAFARRCRSTSDCRYLEEMVKYLQSEVDRSGYDNVRIIQNTWEEVDLEKEELLGRFDLAFASMSPGINNLETINKALDCTKEYFYFSSFAGLRENDLLTNLWPALYDDTLPAWPDQVVFVLNLLYSFGLFINFEVWEERRSVELALPEALAGLLDELRNFGKEPSDAEEKLKDLLNKKMKEGVLLQKNRTRLGQILAKKTQ
ncbi:MAG: class I SAM-dependent methyltransferase [Firmicutes bacterium]|nr:class I SAM-dependent methyltransferase [Bacillota bacterium]